MKISSRGCPTAGDLSSLIDNGLRMRYCPRFCRILVMVVLGDGSRDGCLLGEKIIIYALHSVIGSLFFISVSIFTLFHTEYPAEENLERTTIQTFKGGRSNSSNISTLKTRQLHRTLPVSILLRTIDKLLLLLQLHHILIFQLQRLPLPSVTMWLQIQ